MDNKLIRALASLNKKEFLDFGKFLHSTYFNSSESNVKLYNYLKHFHPSFNSHEISKEKAFAAIYGSIEYDDKKLRDRFTHLLSLFKIFLAIEKYNENNFDFKNNLISALHEKGLDSMLQDEYKATTVLIEKMKYKDESYYLNKYLFEVSKRENDELRIPSSQRDTLYKNVKIEIDDAIYFFLIVMLKEYSIVTNTERHVNVDHKLKFFEQIINYLSNEEENYKNILLINIFYNFFQIYKIKQGYSLIYKIKDLLIEHREQLQERIFKMLFIELYNYCKRRQSCGEKDFGTISFELMNEMLEREVFLKEDGTMSDHTYINLTASGLRENKIDWTENFIDHYQNKVPIKERENAFNYNNAVLFYMKGYGKENQIKDYSYNVALGYLNKVKSDDFYYMTRIKNHSLKIFYELNYLDEATYFIDSYLHFLTRNPKIPQRLAERYYNFITFLQRLIRLKIKTDDFNLHKLKSELIDNYNTEYKGWLIQMIDELLIQ